MDVQIFTDGGSRGNPGPAASAFIVKNDSSVFAKGSLYLGLATNNVAEYKAVILALKWLKDFYIKNEIAKATFILDSELVVKQLNGLYKVKDEKIKKLNSIVLESIASLPVSFSFNAVKRDKNKEADRLVNETLDANS